MTHSRKFDADGHLFDEVYANSRGKDPASIPWINAKPHPLVATWLDDQRSLGAERTGQRALVVGSGLGDDANALAELGWRVTAFDYSPQAIDWSRKRFPDSPISWHVANLFALPESWRRRYDLVVEVHTIQALPVTRRQGTIQAIIDTVASDGTLLVVTMTRDIRQPLRGRPWPLTEQELRSIEHDGLNEVDRVTIPSASPEQPGRVRATFQRHQAG